MSQTIDIVLPEGQLEGTSATLATWLVNVGDQVTEGQPLAELETDKVVMEVCAAKSGQITELTTKVGDEVEPEQSLGKLALGAKPTKSQVDEKDSATSNNAPESSSLDPVSEIGSEEGDDARQFVSPAVRRLLRENNLKIDPIPGTGKRGRVTRDDVVRYLKDPKPRAQSSQPKAMEQTATQTTQIEPMDKNKTTASVSPYQAAERSSRALEGRMVPHSKMRKSIASHMVESLLETSPHVTSVFEMDMTNIMEHRKWHKKEFEALGVKLTFTSYFLAAMAKAVKEVPQTNARFHEDALEMFSDVNIGVGTALGDAGLVVPVIEQVQEMNLFEISKRLGDITAKARDGKLTTTDMKNGTITISNHGVSGSLFATPIIINQPQVAILGVGKLEKRVVVESVNGVDTMVIRPKCYVSLSIDHRALDAHQTNLFLNHFVNEIENWGE